jgi:hypothetical protein
MRPTTRVAVAALTMVAVSAGGAQAQLPICPHAVPSDLYRAACVPGLRLAVTRMLFDLSIDHVLKGERDPILRQPGDIFRTFVSDDTFEHNASLHSYLEKIGPLKFTRIDTATGMIQVSIPDTSRRFTGTIVLGETNVPVTIQMPAQVDAAYWRTPSVLQVAFWEGQRISAEVEMPNADAFAFEAWCLVVSTDGVRIVTSGDAPDILIRVDCSP